MQKSRIVFFMLTLVGIATNIMADAMPASLLNWQKQNHIPAVSMTIDNSNGTKSYYSGTTAIGNTTKLQQHDYFQIGSITKTFTAAAILTLEQNGQLSINDPLGKYLKNYPRWSKITLKQLLNMTSGIYNYTDALPIMSLPKAQQEKLYSADELVQIAYKHKDYFASGSSWKYSNTNYVLLGMVVEQVSEHNLGEYLPLTFFEPLELNYTQYVDNGFPSNVKPFLVHGYRDNKDVTDINLSSYDAAGAVISNTNDIAKWFRLLMSGQVLAKTQQQELTSTISIGEHKPKPTSARFGLGVYEYTSTQYGKIWWYQGVTEGYVAFVGYLPQKDVSFAIMTNKRNSANINYFMPDNQLMKTLIPQILKTQ
ncbi:MAG: class A beta-lactamase-related serine hydrolase [Neisseriales bacterium]|nr:MAG: class A beta-lactamase-related serine hydrolase [Neisseriales bacterium]